MVSVDHPFSPNAATIPTSEGGPYGDGDFWLQAPANCFAAVRHGYGPTKVMRVYICLTGKVTLSACSQPPPIAGPLSAATLDEIDARIAAFAGTGMRLIVRFNNNFGPIGPDAKDAPVDVILQHIDQLAPILLRQRDIVFALEAGFIGTWGEWHHSTNGNDTAAVHKQVLDKEAAHFGGIFPILARYPGQLLTYVGNAVPPAHFGLHDDYYASSPDDGTTWRSCLTVNGYCLANTTLAQLEDYGAAVAANTMFVGEFGESYPTLQACSALEAYSYRFRLQSISLNIFPFEIATQLENAGCLFGFLNKTGARIEIERARIVGHPVGNGSLYVALTMRNTGYGRVIRPRPMTLVLFNGNDHTQIPIPLASADLRMLAASATPASTEFEFTVAMHANVPSGQLSVALLIPDPAPSLGWLERRAEQGHFIFESW